MKKTSLRRTNITCLVAAALIVGIGTLPCAWGHQAEDNSVDTLLQEAVRASEQDQSDVAIAKLTEVIRKDSKHSLALYLRGREHFRHGDVAKSVADFDAAVELNPKSASRQWERGISYYYAGDFEKGAKQFEEYQTYHNQDVENSVWRYLCVARTDGVTRARETMLPIDRDPRVPMMRIYDLYRGKAKPEDVLEEAKKDNPSRDALNSRLFYAHLYIGLWEEAAGNSAEASKHILEAEKHRIGHYMWDVAHVHAERLRKEPESKP
jgi:lipoprotein NlpI